MLSVIVMTIDQPHDVMIQILESIVQLQNWKPPVLLTVILHLLIYFEVY
jgi:hypothetical protein